MSKELVISISKDDLSAILEALDVNLYDLKKLIKKAENGEVDPSLNSIKLIEHWYEEIQHKDKVATEIAEILECDWTSYVTGVTNP